MSSKRKSVGEVKASLTFSLAVPPVPASRPRVTRWGTYYAKTYKQWMAAAHAALDKCVICASSAKALRNAPLHVVLEHVVQRPKTTQRDYPRGDVDNYAKATLDAITHCQIVWEDDDQVLNLVSSKRFATDGEDPHTKVMICQL
jgi:Holliday junction resolvase RusA-like endonuclease